MTMLLSIRKIIQKPKSRIKKFIDYLDKDKSSKFIKSYYFKNRNNNKGIAKNIWRKNKYWDCFYQSLPHSEKSEYYVPYDYYDIEIEPIYNDPTKSVYANEKNYYDKLFRDSGVRMPDTFFRCINYVYLDKYYKPINDVISCINNIRQDIIIKQSYGAGGGSRVRKFYYNHETRQLENNGFVLNIDEYCKTMNGNLIIQSVIQQHNDTAKFHPWSVNTMRLISYRSFQTNDIHMLGQTLRMGVKKSYVDNASSGGIAAGINDDGTLMKYAVRQYGDYYIKHPDTNVVFEGSVIPSFAKVRETVKRLADIIPHQRLIGWDFAVDIEGTPVLIELNTGVGMWMHQFILGKPLFGNYWKEVYDYIHSRKQR
jgi:hypothetical protein